MHTLFLHTASADATAIALYDGDDVMEHKTWPAQQNESETLLPAVQELLKEHSLSPDDIQQLIVCVGPGGFTSTRVGVSAANAWAFAKQIPCVGVSVFDLYAGFEGAVVVSANPKEAWIQMPGEDPAFFHQEDFPGDFSGPFTGHITDVWRAFLEERGGQSVDHQPSLPTPSTLDFRNQVLKPWYYKDPNITWSTKHKPL